jgi:glycosyltransferase involved in cell wall biosynthesis
VIHFFPTFSRDAANTPYGEALRRSGVPHRIIASGVRTHYRTRLGLLFGVIPRFAASAVCSAITSLSPGRPAPDTVVVGSDIAVLVFALVRLLFHRRAVHIVLSSFIYTHRSNPRQDALRQAYFRFVLARTDLVVVHSQLEVERYSHLFAPSRTRFVFIPWATHITGRDALLAEVRAAPGNGAVLAAGRSGRDYRTLFEAMAGVDAELRVICDYANALPDDRPGARTTILTNCHSWDYFREVLRAAVVVIPLAVEDVSAGQMVLIQAMGLASAIVVTDTPTIRDYVTADHDVLLVPRGDVMALRAAILRLLGDAALHTRLASNAQATFDANFTTEEHMQRLLSAIAALAGSCATPYLPQNAEGAV